MRNYISSDDNRTVLYLVASGSHFSILTRLYLLYRFPVIHLHEHHSPTKPTKLKISVYILYQDTIYYKIIWYMWNTVYPKKYARGFCFAVLCCGYTLTDFPISIRLTSLALWQSNDCPSASKATLMNMDKYFMWIHYERLHNHNKAKHNKPVCIFLGMYYTSSAEY